MSRPDLSDQSHHAAYFEGRHFIGHPFDDGSSFVSGKELYRNVEQNLGSDQMEAVTRQTQPQPTSTTYDSRHVEYTYSDKQPSYTNQRNIGHALDSSGIDTANVSSFQHRSNTPRDNPNSRNLIDPLSKSCPVSYATLGAVNEDINWRGPVSPSRYVGHPFSGLSSTLRRYGMPEYDSNYPPSCLGTAQADLDSSLTEEVQRFSNDADSTVLDARTIEQDQADTPIKLSSQPQRLPRLQPRRSPSRFDGSLQGLGQEISGNITSGTHIRGSLQPYQYPTPVALSVRPFPEPGSITMQSPNPSSAFQSTSLNTVPNAAGAVMTQAANVTPQPISGRTQCSHCPQSFTGTNASRVRSLKRHMGRSHPTGPSEEYQCEHCDATVSRSDLRVRHLERVHKINIPTTPRNRRREPAIEDLLEGSFRRIVL